MNYYERYSGDYSRDTAHLSLTEHGAYTLLLDAYYSTERPLEAPYPPLYRICRAMSKLEQASVRAVADEFFPISDDGLRHNSRADRDIPKALKRINSARDNGGKGGRPKKPNRNPMGYENKTQQKPNGLSDENPTGNPLGYPPETQPGEASPDPRPQTPKVKPIRRAEPDYFQRFWAAFPARPRRAAKHKCLDIWVAKGLEPIGESIVEHVKAMALTKPWQEGFEPAPLTYLNQRRWEDGLPSVARVGVPDGLMYE